MAELQPYKAGYYLWQYVPSLAAAVIFLILFSSASIFHFWKYGRLAVGLCHWGIMYVLTSVLKRSEKLLLIHLVEMIGFAARAAAHSSTGELIPYCVQNVFILLGPTLFAATVYVTLGRIIRSIHTERYSFIRVNWLTKVFVTADILSFLIQDAAAGIMSMGSMRVWDRILSLPVLLFKLSCSPCLL